MARQITFLNGITWGRATGVTNIKGASHPRTMFFYGFETSPKSKRP